MTHLVYPPKFYITIVFSWDDHNTQETLEKIGYAKFWGVNKVIMVYVNIVNELTISKHTSACGTIPCKSLVTDTTVRPVTVVAISV